jgi:hypothetical protein
MLFDLNQFYNYYTNPRNLKYDPNPPIYNYFDKNNNSHTSIKSGNYIEINGTKLYVDVLNPSTKNIIFTIYDPSDNNYLDNHFNFG